MPGPDDAIWGPSSQRTGPDDLVVTAPAPAPRRRSRSPLAAAAAATLVIAGAVAVGLAVSGSSPSLAGKTPSQILAASLAAARSAGSFHVASTTGSDAGDLLSFDIGPNGATYSVSSGGTTGLTVVVVHRQTYLRATGSGVPASYAGKWLRVPASEASDVGPTLEILTPSGFLDAFVALTGSISRISAPAGSSDVLLRGTVSPSTTLGTQADVGTLEISGTAPFYPVKLTYSDPQQGEQIYVFSRWGEQVPSTPPAGAVDAPSSLFSPQPAAGEDVVTQANLQTALTGARVYYTENSQSYAGLDPSTFAGIDTGLTAVPGSSPSTGAKTISLTSSGDWVVEAAWTPTTRDCFAIVNAQGTAPLDGADRTGTYYLESPGVAESSCRAAAYAVPGTVAGATLSTTGFPGSS